MLTQHIALVPEAGGVDPSELSRVSAALQKQVTRDLQPSWGVSATVDAFHELEDIPVGYWPIVIGTGDLRRAAGVHLDRNGQPYAHITLSPRWSVQASRVCLEMLINPYGDRTTTAPSPRAHQGLVEMLVEVCAPCAGAGHGYTINGVEVADFCMPAFYGASSLGRERFSFNGSLTAPFQLLRGGYLAWYEPGTNDWWLRALPGSTALDVRLGVVEEGLFSARDLVRKRGPLRLWGEAGGTFGLLTSGNPEREQAATASRNRALRLRSLLGQRLEETLQDEQEGCLHDDAYDAEEPHHVAQTVVEEVEEQVTTAYQLRHLSEDGAPLEVAALYEPHAEIAPPPQLPSNPPPLPVERVSRPSEVARARRALPAENVQAVRAAPSIAPRELLTLSPPQKRHDGIVIASVALAAAALFGLIWTQHAATEQARLNAQSARSVQPPPAAASQAPPAPPVAPIAATPVEAPREKPTPERRARVKPSEEAPKQEPRKVEPAPTPAVAPVIAHQKPETSLDELLDTRR